MSNTRSPSNIHSPRRRIRDFAKGLATTLIAIPLTSSVAADLPDAAQSDPVALGWMVGSPPPPDKTIRFADGSFYKFPQSRWTLSHWREIFPTRNVSRGEGPVSALPRGKPASLDGLTFTPIGSDKTMTWGESLGANYTDAIVVLHRGQVVYEKYFPILPADRQHIAFSVTKSFIGTLGAMLVAEGKLDPGATVARYIPELADSGFGDATVQQVLDMTTALDYSEDYADPNSSFLPYARAAGMMPLPPGYTGPTSIYDFVRGIAKSGTHGTEFHYRSPNTDVLGWLIARVTGKSPDAVLQERIWSQLGAGRRRLHGTRPHRHRDGGRRFQHEAPRPGAIRRDDPPGRQIQRQAGRACRRSLKESVAAPVPRRSHSAATRPCRAGATTTSGGSRTTITARSWREASTARRSTSIRRPRW